MTKKNGKTPRNSEKKLFKCFIPTCTKFGRARDMFATTYLDFVSPYPGAPKVKTEFKDVLVCRACMREGGYEVVESLGKGTPRPKRVKKTVVKADAAGVTTGQSLAA